MREGVIRAGSAGTTVVGFFTYSVPSCFGVCFFGVALCYGVAEATLLFLFDWF